MKVRFKTSLATTESSYDYGEVADIPEAWAKQLLSAGTVEKVDKTTMLGADRRTFDDGADRDIATKPMGENRKAH